LKETTDNRFVILGRPALQKRKKREKVSYWKYYLFFFT
jgi:hypothetical protein